jgi:hypothetical protein
MRFDSKTGEEELRKRRFEELPIVLSTYRECEYWPNSFLDGTSCLFS